VIKNVTAKTPQYPIEDIMNEQAVAQSPLQHILDYIEYSFEPTLDSWIAFLRALKECLQRQSIPARILMKHSRVQDAYLEYLYSCNPTVSDDGFDTLSKFGSINQHPSTPITRHTVPRHGLTNNKTGCEQCKLSAENVTALKVKIQEKDSQLNAAKQITLEADGENKQLVQSLQNKHYRTLSALSCKTIGDIVYQLVQGADETNLTAIFSNMKFVAYVVNKARTLLSHLEAFANRPLSSESEQNAGTTAVFIDNQSHVDMASDVGNLIGDIYTKYILENSKGHGSSVTEKDYKSRISGRIVEYISGLLLELEEQLMEPIAFIYPDVKIETLTSGELQAEPVLVAEEDMPLDIPYATHACLLSLLTLYKNLSISPFSTWNEFVTSIRSGVDDARRHCKDVVMEEGCEMYSAFISSAEEQFVFLEKAQSIFERLASIIVIIERDMLYSIEQKLFLQEIVSILIHMFIQGLTPTSVSDNGLYEIKRTATAMIDQTPHQFTTLLKELFSSIVQLESPGFFLGTIVGNKVKTLPEFVSFSRNIFETIKNQRGLYDKRITDLSSTIDSLRAQVKSSDMACIISEAESENDGDDYDEDVEEAGGEYTVDNRRMDTDIGSSVHSRVGPTGLRKSIEGSSSSKPLHITGSKVPLALKEYEEDIDSRMVRPLRAKRNAKDPRNTDALLRKDSRIQWQRSKISTLALELDIANNAVIKMQEEHQVLVKEAEALRQSERASYTLNSTLSKYKQAYTHIIKEMANEPEYLILDEVEEKDVIEVAVKIVALLRRRS
jgi:hypothetical protein